MPRVGQFERVQPMISPIKNPMEFLIDSHDVPMKSDQKSHGNPMKTAIFYAMKTAMNSHEMICIFPGGVEKCPDAQVAKTFLAAAVGDLWRNLLQC